ncbi:MAG: hypothetical protein V4509_01230 [Patescibacteria group bacterium]
MQKKSAPQAPSGTIDLEVVKISRFTIERSKRISTRTASGTFLIEGETEPKQWSLEVWYKNSHNGQSWRFNPTGFVHNRRINQAIKNFLKEQMR